MKTASTALFILTMSVSATSNAQREIKKVGEVLSLKGSVTVDGMRASIGTPVSVNSVIRTASGHVTIVLNADEGIVEIAANSEFRVDEYKSQQHGETQALLRMPAGNMRMLLKPKNGGRQEFKLKSRNVIMGIRGTEVLIFNPTARDMKQQFVVIDGRAEVYGENGEIGNAVILNRMEALEISGSRVDEGKVVKVTPQNAIDMIRSIGGTTVLESADQTTGSGEATQIIEADETESTLLDHSRGLPDLPAVIDSDVVIDIEGP
jgi:hypothetical protein